MDPHSALPAHEDSSCLDVGIVRNETRKTSAATINNHWLELFLVCQMGQMASELSYSLFVLSAVIDSCELLVEHLAFMRSTGICPCVVLVVCVCSCSLLVGL